MNLSTVGILPDLRSPESIINDIEYKEKILADVLSLDKIKLTVQDINTSCPNQCKEVYAPGHKHNDLDNRNRPIKKQVHKEPTIQQNSSDEDSVINKPSVTVKSIPGDWNLSQVELNSVDHTGILPNQPSYTYERKLSVTDSSLSDWEIV